MKKLFFVISTLLIGSFLFADVTDTIRNEVPGNYRRQCEKGGNIITLNYEYNEQNKSVNVYLPYGYNESDKSTKYDVVYLLHGGSDNISSFLGSTSYKTPLANIFDNMIAQRDVKPFIVVCPTYYSKVHNDMYDVKAFPKELRNTLIPLIDSSFNTKTDRKNRTFGGFSMGGAATWYVFIECLDLFKNYLPLSGDCWALGMQAGKNLPKQTSDYLQQAVYNQEYTSRDFRIFAATGTKDIAYENMTPQINAMKTSSIFNYTTGDFNNGNLIYYVVDKNVHHYSNLYEYIYNALLIFIY